MKREDSKIDKFFSKLVDFGTPEGIRTPDPLLRREVLYPAELLALVGTYGIVP